MSLASRPPATPAEPAAVPFVTGLARHGTAVALADGRRELTYAELAELATDVGAGIGSSRSLVLIEMTRSIDAVVAYLGCLAGGHVPLLAAAGSERHAGALADAYDVDVVVRAGDGDVVVERRRPAPAHELHPELALLLSTSGSTGSPKLVRLSHENLQANAASIVESLGLTGADRAITALPLHYSYGLSVLHSHLLVGGAVVTTETSVVDPCFWDLVARYGVTSLAGVPHTFDLLDRSGFAARATPTLRLVTQAGGRWSPERVRAWAELGRERGFDLRVMYGQTEATARMTCLPAELALDDPASIGVPIPGGSIRLEPVGDVPGADRDHAVGELVYTGPNVMLGYAHEPADLALGRTVRELRTGDLARLRDGRYEIVGRRARFAKVLGLRIDLARAETLLDDFGVVAAVVDHESRLCVLAEPPADPERVRSVLAHEFGVPTGSVHVVVDELPRRPNGKPDLAAVSRRVAARPDDTPDPVPVVAGGAELRARLAAALGRTDVRDDDSFVSLGGDSLSYVECSLVVEEALGGLPDGWHLRPVGELAALAESRPDRRRWWRSRGRQVETSLVLRAAAILMIVASHVKLVDLQGGAYVLLAVAGYNFARFQLTGVDRITRLRSIGRSAWRVAAPSVVWITAVLVTVGGGYRWTNALLINGLLPTDEQAFSDVWHFWFVEVLLWSVIGCGLLLTVRAVDRWERHFPFALPAALMLVALLGRYHVVAPLDGPWATTANALLWLFALGWAAARARTQVQRALLSAVVLVAMHDFFVPLDRPRELTVVAGVLLLVWVPSVRLPRLVVPVVAVLASASLYVYLVHWQVYRRLPDDVPLLLAWVASISAGLAYWWAWERVTSIVTSTAARRRAARSAARASHGSIVAAAGPVDGRA